jgi:hypothetical protein
VAQLALAREYGFASWTALRTETERRRSETPAARWSFGGATAIETMAGVLYPGMLVCGPGHVAMEGRLIPSAEIAHRLSQSLTDIMASMAAHQLPALDDVTVTDDHGTRYLLHSAGISWTGEVWVSLHLDPVPARDRGWLELRNRHGSTTRLLRSGRPTVRVAMPTPLPDTERALSQARSAIECQLLGIDTGNVLTPDVIEGLPPAWSGMLDAAARTDGPRRHIDIEAALPRVDDITMHLDSLGSEPDCWYVHLRATPGWWNYSEDQKRKWAVLSVHAEDDRGGRYLGSFGGGTSRDDHEEGTVRFLPRLDPLAHTVTLTFSGTTTQVAVDVRLEPGAPPNS